MMTNRYLLTASTTPFFFSCFTLLLLLLSLKNYSNSSKFTIAPSPVDTIVDPVSGIAYVIDTVFTFYPETFEEVVSYVKRRADESPADAINQQSQDKSTELDTIIIFDPDTFKETMIVVNPKTGVRDTIYENKK